MSLPLNIKFGQKFVGIHLDEIISKYWILASIAPSDQLILFDLSSTEWLALEELTFLFGWIRHLILENKQIKVILPRISGNVKRKKCLISLWIKWRIFSIYNELLYDKGRLEDYFEVSPSVNSIINEEIRRQELDNLPESLDDIRVVPFQAIGTSGYGNINSIDEFLHYKIQKPLNLAAQIQEVLQKHTDRTDAENRYLSNIITNELFLNVIHHAFESTRHQPQECYIAISLKPMLKLSSIKDTENRNRIENRKKQFGETFSEARQRIELCTDDFAQKMLEYHVVHTITNGYNSERSPETISFFRNQGNNSPFRNEDFIEFTFIDFGQGIVSSLRETYLKHKDRSNYEHLILDMNGKFNQQCVDTQILEYAFLLNSSRHPFDIELQKEYEVPRGLYFVVDMVRRLDGMLVARSGRGKVVFDFSKKVERILEAVKYSPYDHDLPNFHGSLISITIPTTVSNRKGNITKSLAQFPSHIENRDQYYFALIDILQTIADRTNEPTSANRQTLQELYRQIFDEINNILDRFLNKFTLLIFDFSGFNVQPLSHKLLFFFATSPKINNKTSIVITHFPSIEIIHQVQDFINFRLRNKLPSSYLYKPIPIIQSLDEIHWLSVSDIDDAEKLTELLLYETHILATSDFHQPQDYVGHFFRIDQYGNVSSTIPIAEKLLNNSNHEG